MLVSHDLGVAEIAVAIDSVRFTPLVLGDRTENDTTVNYPKDLYQDEQGALWIAQSRSISRYQNKTLRRYSFPSYCQTNSFLRSFSFVPDGFGSFIVVSQSGYCFWYNRVQDTFIALELPRGTRFEAVSALLPIRQGVLLIGHSQGITEMRIDAQGNVLGCTPWWNHGGISSLHKATDGRLYIGTWNDGLFTALLPTLSTKFFSPQSCQIPFKTINAILSTPNHEIWASSDKGLVLLNPIHIRTVDVEADASTYIQAIASSGRGVLYTSNGSSMYKITAHSDYSPQIENVSSSTRIGGDILSVATTEHYVWYSTIEGQLFRVQKYAEAKYHVKTLSKHESIPTLSGTVRNPTIFHLFADSHSRLWGCAELAAGVLRIDEQASSLAHANAQHYDERRGLMSVIRFFSETTDGTLFCAGRSQGNVGYLFRYSEQRDRFEDISIALSDGTIHPGFEVNALWAKEQNDIWLCTNQGLFHHTARGIDSIPIIYASTGEKVRNFKSITSDSSGVLWIGTSFGVLVYYPNGSYFFLNEFNGLPANETVLRAMLYDRHTNSIIVGTVGGMAFIPISSAIQKITATPFFTSIRVGDAKQSLSALESAGLFAPGARHTNTKEFVLPYHSSIQVQVLSIAFGNSTMYYQYRLLNNQTDTSWSPSQVESKFTILDLPEGVYRLEMRAIQDGAYRWSEPLVFTLSVAPAWYQRWWVSVIISTGAGVLMWGIVKINVRRLEHRKQELQQLVDEKTHALLETAEELQRQNERLLELNNEKNEFLGIVSHDLKNPITVVKGTAEFMLESEEHMDTDMRTELLRTILQSSARMLNLVVNLLDVNRLERGGFTTNFTEFDMLPLVEHIIAFYRQPAKDKNIHLELQVLGSQCVFADQHATEQIIDNLISNAIKYSPLSRSVFIRITEKIGCVRIEVQDQGPGLSNDDLKKLFGKFARLTPKPTAGEHSTGLGLSIVKKMVEHMSGRVWCESTLGHGATFIVELPTAKPPLSSS